MQLSAGKVKLKLLKEEIQGEPISVLYAKVKVLHIAYVFI
jgi:hypothetical protein